MSKYEDPFENAVRSFARWAVVGLVLFIPSCMFGMPHYNVWEQEMTGKAELSRADQNRQIRVSEAQAKLESAKLDAASEIERARGTAEANKIMAESLKGDGADHYLRLRYIMMLEEHKNVAREVIYIPGSALPITEAGRAVPHTTNVEVIAPTSKDGKN